MTDLIKLDAATLAAKIAAREVSATEVTQACLDQIAANMRDAKAEPTWVGMDGFAAAICFNTIEAEKQKLPV